MGDKHSRTQQPKRYIISSTQVNKTKTTCLLRDSRKNSPTKPQNRFVRLHDACARKTHQHVFCPRVRLPILQSKNHQITSNGQPTTPPKRHTAAQTKASVGPLGVWLCAITAGSKGSGYKYLDQRTSSDPIDLQYRFYRLRIYSHLAP